jgi:hypothetical protein
MSSGARNRDRNHLDEAPCTVRAVGLDLYAGSLTRYHVGDWLTVVARYAMERGATLRVIGRDPAPEDVVSDPETIEAMVLDWRQAVGDALGIPLEWPEDGGAPYETDKVTWDGFGAVVLLAAYDEYPSLRDARDVAELFEQAAAVAAARTASTTRYPSITLGVEWWLPEPVPAAFEVARPSGQLTMMGNVSRLRSELRTLNERTLRMSVDDMNAARRNTPESGATVESAAPFGLAVLSGLVAWADENRQPLLMDY